MHLRITLALILCCATVSMLSAQKANPFELLWRKPGAVAITPAKTVTSPVADTALIDVPPVVPVTEITPETAPEITPEITRDTQALVVPDAPVATEEAIQDAGETETAEVEIQPQEGTPALSDTTSKSAISTPPVSPGTGASAPLLHVRADDSASPAILVILFGLILSLLAWGMSLNRDFLKNIYRAALNENLSSLLYREQRFATTQYLYYTIYLIFFFNGGMFLYFLGKQSGWPGWVFSSIWASIGLVTLVYCLRHLCLSILGATYPVSKEVTHFSFSILLHNILLGVALIPVNLFLAFGPDDLYKAVIVVGILLSGLIYVARQFRGLLIGASLISANFFHFFIYLCAVEILPLFALVKFVHN